MIRALHVLFVRATYARGLRRAPSIMVNHMVKRTVLPTPPLGPRPALASGAYLARTLSLQRA